MEANRESAEELIARARNALAADDDAEAARLVQKSLRLCETDEGLALDEHISRFGPGSPAALAVARILDAKRGDHHAILNLPPGDAAAADVKRAYRKVSLEVHPDRNQAVGADDAFKRLTESFKALLEQQRAETLGDVFRRYADSSSGLLLFDELRAALADLKRDDLVPMDRSTLEELQSNGAAGITIAEWRALVKSLKKTSKQQQQQPSAAKDPWARGRPTSAAASRVDGVQGETIGGVFRRHDPGNGLLDLLTVREALAELSIPLNTRDAEDALSALDADHEESGAINIDTWRVLVKSLRPPNFKSPPQSSTSFVEEPEEEEEEADEEVEEAMREAAARVAARERMRATSAEPGEVGVEFDPEPAPPPITIGGVFRRLERENALEAGFLTIEQLPDALTELGLYDTPQARAAVAALDITNATEFDMAQFRRLCKSLR